MKGLLVHHTAPTRQTQSAAKSSRLPAVTQARGVSQETYQREARSVTRPQQYSNGWSGSHSPQPRRLEEAATTARPWPKEEELPARVIIYYLTGWERSILHFSVNDGPWKDLALTQVGSSDGAWSTVTVDTSERFGSPEVPLLQFVINNGRGDWDKPPSGGNYVVREAGTFAIMHGKIIQVSGPSCLVVSDLDDTMVGDDEASTAFKKFWETEAVLYGSRLVYNTGRALDKWLALWQQKRHCLAAPDILVSSVGTKVYKRKEGRWQEDPTFAARLDEGWDLEAVRNAAYESLATVGKEHMHFRAPDEQNEHKVTCGVHVDIVDQVVQRIQGALRTGGVRARLILSGRGDWRFLDIVAYNAGKLKALEYVREELGFPSSATLACGDSGNDIDMLAGPNLAVVVGNAETDLKKWVKEAQRKEAGSNGSRRLMSAQQSRAWGILEALEQLGFKPLEPELREIPTDAALQEIPSKPVKKR